METKKGRGQHVIGHYPSGLPIYSKFSEEAKILHAEDREHGSYHVEDHGAGVHGVYFKKPRERFPKYVATASSMEGAHQRIEVHAGRVLEEQPRPRFARMRALSDVVAERAAARRKPPTMGIGYSGDDTVISGRPLVLHRAPPRARPKPGTYFVLVGGMISTLCPGCWKAWHLDPRSLPREVHCTDEVPGGDGYYACVSLAANEERREGEG